jgi:hypothetical protein
MDTILCKICIWHNGKIKNDLYGCINPHWLKIHKKTNWLVEGYGK